MSVELNRYVRGRLTLELEAEDGWVVKCEVYDMRSMGGSLEVVADYGPPLDADRVQSSPTYRLKMAVDATLKPVGDPGYVGCMEVIVP